jgi:imidazolonepropionase-like amidohydrolase
VAGTDGSGMELVRELELYVAAGFSPSEALASATSAPAHLVGADARTGSIAVGKSADLVLVEGDPSRNVGDLRHTRIVMMDGKLMDADALRAAGGFGGRPSIID